MILTLTFKMAIPKIISIEGNIGSGKTTLMKALRDYYRDDPNVIFLREPVDEWEAIKDSEGNSMLKKFYSDQAKYSFSFQMMAYISRLSILREAVRKNPDALFITERTLDSDRNIFAAMLYDDGKIEDVDYQIYLRWFDEFKQDLPISKFIYVKTDPDICYDRINIRAREGEEVIPLQYLEKCHHYHEIFLSTGKDDRTMVINGNEDIRKYPMYLDWMVNEIYWTVYEISNPI